ncbi:MAG TPA: hypothetical protein VMW75_28720 [Thermoanaerobaculia bacterium]|nr:hypothetical protein [Thermoanaerobaculia bacterium]
MIDASQLSRAVLEDALGQIADRLFLDINPVGCPAELRDQDVYNPDKDWDIDDLEFIAGLLRTAGLAPDRLGDQPPRDDPPAASGPHPRCRPAPAGRVAAPRPCDLRSQP